MLTSDNTQTIERIRAANKALLPLCSDPPPAYWIGNGDAGTSWCEACAEAEVARLNRAAKTTKRNPGEDFFVDGGWEAHESEGNVACEGCGIQLSYTLLRYGVISETDHYVENPLYQHPMPSEAYEVCALLEQAPYMNRPEDGPIVADVLRVGETAVQLIGYREELARWADDGGAANNPPHLGLCVSTG